MRPIERSEVAALQIGQSDRLQQAPGVTTLAMPWPVSRKKLRSIHNPRYHDDGGICVEGEIPDFAKTTYAGLSHCGG